MLSTQFGLRLIGCQELVYLRVISVGHYII